MAPRGRRAEAAEPEAIHEFGVRGRKTGVYLPDRGERDEYGMQPTAGIFSSPRKADASASSDGDSGSEAMDIPSSAGPGPQTLLKGRSSNIQYPIPKSRSPLKTNLRSPARRNPHLERLSSPTRGSVVEDRDATVTRKLDFAGRPNGPRAAARGRPNGISHVEEEDEDEDEDDMPAAAGGDADDDPDLMDMLDEATNIVDAHNGLDDYDDDEEPIAKQPTSAKRGRGRPKGSGKPQARQPSPDPSDADEPQDQDQDEDEEEEPPVQQRRRGRPAGKTRAEESQPAAPSRKRRSLRDSMGEEDAADGPEEDSRGAKRQRTKGPAAPKPEPPVKRGRGRPSDASKADKGAKPKPRGRAARRPAKAAAADDADAGDDAGETSFMALQRGPPMPRSRGLVSVRRDDVNQTRSGRHSYRPVDYWRGEEVIVGEEAPGDNLHHDDFVLPTIQEVVRVPESTLPSKRAPRSKTRARSKRATAAAPVVEEDEELEEWELGAGTVSGEVVLWEPEHELYPPAEDEPVTIAEEQIATAGDAIRTHEVRDATFRFGKTLNTPFMGAGVVDLPPGAEKRPKNSRKMHMVFVVHYGKVLVTVNEAQFRISAGGTWAVPRGNYYSITNDYDNPARIFFSQGCEVAPQTSEPTNQSMVA